MNDATHDVFVSYSRQESAFAKLLERKLEAFKPPKGLGLPARRLRVFLDTSDIRGEDYDQTIARELSLSRNLIVLCSPAARGSRFVDDEIRRYTAVRHEAGEKPSVVPLLVDGIPNNEATTPEDEKLKAFPEALYEVAEMPLAQDFRHFDMKRNKLNGGHYRDAWFAMLATLLDVERRALEERDRRRAARQRNIILGLGLTIIAALSLLTVYAFRQQQIAAAQRDLAEQRLQVAQARELAARSGFLQSRKAYLMRPAMLLAIESLRRHSTPQGTSALDSGLSLALLPGLKIPLADAENVLFSPDGKSFIVAQPDGTLTFYSRAGRKEGPMIRHPGGIKGAALSPDGTMLATAGRDKTARLWDVFSGAEIAVLPHKSYLDNVSFGPTGERLITAGQKTGTVVIWNIAAQQIEREFEAPCNRLDKPGMSAVLSPDGRWLVTTGHGRDAFVWDMESPGAPGKPIALRHDGWVYASAFTPTGEQLMTGGAGQKARVWRVGDWTQDREMQHDTGFGEGNILDLAVSSDGRLIATASTRSQQVGAPSIFGAVGLVRVWELATGREVGRIERDGAARAVSFAPDGYTLAISGGRSVQLWSAEPGHAMRPLGHENSLQRPVAVRHLAVSRRGTWIAASRERKALLWETQTGREAGRHEVEGRYAADLAFAPTDSLLAIATSGGAVVWDWARNTSRTLPQPDTYVNEVAFVSGGRLLAAASLQAFWAWDLETAAIEHRYAYEEEKEHSLALSPDGARFAIAGGRIYMDQGSPATARVWEVATGKLLQTFHYKGVAGTMAFNGNATRLVTGGEGGNVRLWDVETGALVAHFTHDDSVRAVAFSHDDIWIAAAGREGTLRVWEVATRQETSRINLGLSPSALHFSTDNRILWIGTQSGTIQQRIWHPQDLIEAACARLTKNFTEAEWQEYMGDGPNRAVCDELTE
jgi:WD40 repeat protein